jgi:YegS/Rv2252/BmrU family lipid kinase
MASMSNIIVAVAETARQADLLSWIRQHRDTLAGFEILTTADLAPSLRTAAFSSLERSETRALEDGGDLLLAARILAGEVVGVVCFADPDSRPGGSRIDGLIRACLLQQIPLALNGATATLALRGLARSRMAYLIFNPVAGQGDPQQELALIRSLLEPRILLTVVMTKPGLDPADQARDLVKAIQARPPAEAETCMILASGGDGTVSAVAGALIGSGVPLGILPRGTANAFAVAMNIPTDLRAACTTILVGNTRVVDAARCNDIPMVLLAGVGFEAGMVEGASRELKNRIGPLAYILSGARQIAALEPFRATVVIDGEERELVTSAITVANAAPPTSVLAQGYGEVVPDDGLLEITIASPTNRLEGLQVLSVLVGSAMFSNPTNQENLLCFRAAHLRISTDPPQRLVVDGELIEANPVEFTCLPEALTVLAPLPPGGGR